MSEIVHVWKEPHSERDRNQEHQPDELTPRADQDLHESSDKHVSECATVKANLPRLNQINEEGAKEPIDSTGGTDVDLVRNEHRTHGSSAHSADDVDAPNTPPSRRL